MQYRHAEISKQEAIYSERHARSEEIEALATSSDNLFIAGRKFDALVEAVLRQAIYGVTQSNRLSGHTAAVRAVALSREGQLIASGSEDTTVKLWKQDGTLVATLSGHTATVWGVAISRDGQTIASASEDKTVKLWQQDGTLLTTLQGYKATLFSPYVTITSSNSETGTTVLY